MRVLVTGAAGFIGFHLSKRLLEKGCTVFGMDNLNDYYDVNLKKARLVQLQQSPEFIFQQLDLADGRNLNRFVADSEPEVVVNLAAQAGVRYSLDNPLAYVNSNLVGFVNLMEACARAASLRHFVFASSSSVYGANIKVPFSEHDNVDHPISLYAVTKKSNELIAHSYSHLYDMPVTGLRFFTVYGTWGRPDMAYFKFVLQSSRGAVLSNARYKIYNLGNHQPVDLLKFIEIIEQALGIQARKTFRPMQPGDVVSTYAQMDDLYEATGFRPTTPIEEGLPKFVRWYREYYAARERVAC